ncbi:MAG: hypothetical protein V5B44_00145 [Candidatus Accumulibacter necessarius]|uniref:hypothetical protein n=1 Tax=Candidatus Accumulibacter necessarius TaxID=2954386 RepID=UPI002FC340B4
MHGGKVTAEDKRKLRDKLNGLSLELDRYLAQDYGINPKKKEEFAAWRASHQPFHWFAEFYGVMRGSGWVRCGDWESAVCSIQRDSVWNRFTSALMRWNAEEREALFQIIRYAPVLAAIS